MSPKPQPLALNRESSLAQNLQILSPAALSLRLYLKPRSHVNTGALSWRAPDCNYRIAYPTTIFQLLRPLYYTTYYPYRSLIVTLIDPFFKGTLFELLRPLY